MKRLLLIILTLTMVACSPQKRLNRIIALHPELKTTTTVNIYDTLYYESVSYDTIFNIIDLIDSLKKEDKPNPVEITVGEGKNTSNLTIYPDGKTKLNNTQQPDTVYLQGTTQVDSFMTTTKEKIVYKMNKFEMFMFCSGMLMYAIALGFGLIKLISYIKRNKK